MRHPVTAEDWISYLGGELTGARAARMDVHLRDCSDCRALVDDLREADRCLAEAVGDLRRAAEPRAEVVERARLLFFERVRSGGEAGGESLRESVLRLHRLLASMCGSNTARLMLRKAAESCHAGTVEGLTAEGWPAFVAGVALALKPLCGEPAARLVRQASRI